MSHRLPAAFAAAALLLLLLAAAPAAAGEIRAAAEVDCAPTDRPLVYDCTIALSDRRGGAAIAGAEVKVGAEMPTMPMAHNVRPVAAAPAGAPGRYAALLELEMHGPWALRLDLAGPVRDRVIVPLEFQPGAAASGRSK